MIINIKNMFYKFFQIIVYLLLTISIFTIPWSKKIIIPLKNSLDIGFYIDFNFIIIFLFQFFLYIFILFSLFFIKLSNKFIFVSFLYFIFIEIKFFLSYDFLMLYTYTTIYLAIFIIYIISSLKLNKDILKLIAFCIGFNIFLQTFVAIIQFINQSSIGLKILGENEFDNTTLGIAKFYINDYLVIRPYGTFMHPNTLAIFLILSIICIYILDISSIWKKILYFMSSIGIFISMSRIGIITLIIMFLIYSTRIFQNKKIIWVITSLLIFIVLLIEPIQNRFINIFDESMNLRIHYMYTNIMSFFNNNFLYGCIDCSITNLINKYNFNFMFPWEYQYVHNSFILLLNWFGIFGIIILLSFINKKLISKDMLIFFIPIIFFAFFEHNILTSIQILFFLSITLGLYLNIYYKK